MNKTEPKIEKKNKIELKKEREKKTVADMISLYCRKNHKTEKGHLCTECRQLLEYAITRSDKCPFMENKTFCSNCKVHCYEPKMREKIRVVMRFSGPRMLMYHPVMAVRHVVLSKREKRRIDKLNN
ncbi:MAG: nitrous oxide-stimulated promoter family protein [Lachnospiraceae bacterium]|nr:nitrous oxide-stimulated promoter family protein [Lachnospiraceae bacterium]